MAARTPRELVRTWREGAGYTQSDIASQIGDESGQYQRWESGNRPTLPLRMKAKLCLLSGLQLEKVVDAEELATARELVAVMARDTAA